MENKDALVSVLHRFLYSALSLKSYKANVDEERGRARIQIEDTDHHVKMPCAHDDL